MLRRQIAAVTVGAGTTVCAYCSLPRGVKSAKLALWSKHAGTSEDFSPHVDDLEATAGQHGGQPMLLRSPACNLYHQDKPEAVLTATAHEPMEFAVVQTLDTLKDASARARIVPDGHPYQKFKWAVGFARRAARGAYAAALRGFRKR